MTPEFVGVLSLTDDEGQVIEPLPSLKREALFFDRLALPDLSDLLTRKDLDEAFAADLQWLVDNGIVWDPRVDYSKLGRAPIVKPYAARMMMGIDTEATACLWLAQQGCDAVRLVGSQSDLAHKFSFDLDSDERLYASDDGAGSSHY